MAKLITHPHLITKIPDEIKPPSNNFLDHTYLFVGPKGMGKTAFSLQMSKKHFMFECEPGNADHLGGRFVDIYNWDQATQLLQSLVVNVKAGKIDCCIVDDIPSKSS